MVSLISDEKLTGMEPDAYGPWRYDVDLKMETDSPMFPTERSKVRYTLAHYLHHYENLYRHEPA